MTVATQVQQTLAGLKSAQASFETFALQTDNQEAKHLYQNASQQTQQLVDQINQRVQEIQQEEPQYGQQ
jgi:CHASE3 domain sensor protein